MRPLVLHPIFSERATYARYLEVEIALARVQAGLGVIPKAAAEAIASNLTVDKLDFDRLNADMETVGFPIVGLTRQIVEIVPEDHGQYAHWGTTTQDVMDTGLVLALREVMDQLDALLKVGIAGFSKLAEEHSETLIAGRSQLQHAVPVTLGYKLAGWALALHRQRERLQSMRADVLQVQFGGAVGTLAALHPHGTEVRAGLAKSLDINDPRYCWHTHRDSIANFISALGVLCGSFAKIATDIAYMAQTEVAEVSEPTLKGRGTSTAMPNKRNPVLSQQILVAARAVRGAVPMMLEAMAQDHERGTGTWQSEWILIPETCSHCLNAAANITELASDLQIHKDRMAANAALSDGFIYAEAVMMALAASVGRQHAHDLVEEAVEKALGGIPFAEALMNDPDVSRTLSKKDIARIFTGETHMEAGRVATQDMLSRLDL